MESKVLLFVLKTSDKVILINHSLSRLHEVTKQTDMRECGESSLFLVKT